jgi:hypothetical protein
MAPVGPEGHRDPPEGSDGCIGIPALQTGDGGLARPDFTGQLRLGETEGVAPPGHLHPDPKGFALLFVENPKLWILKLLGQMIRKAIAPLSFQRLFLPL